MSTKPKLEFFSDRPALTILPLGEHVVLSGEKTRRAIRLLDELRDILASATPTPQLVRRAVDELGVISAVVCQYYGLRESRLRGRSHERHLVVPRWFVFRFAREFTDLGLREIGEWFRRDHATVRHGCQTLEAMLSMPGEPKVKADYATLRAAVVKALEDAPC